MPSLKLNFGSVTDRGLNPRRAANEDRFLALPEVGLFLVADGVGGRRAGQVASQTVVDTFTEVFSAGFVGGLLPAIKQAIARANESIFAQSHELAELEGMATTLALVAVQNDQAIIAHVGDSRVYRYDGMRLHLETADHSELGDAVRAGEMTIAQAARAHQQNVINRALGIEPEVDADFKVVPVDSRTRFLLCSDGITRHVSDTELETLLARPASSPQRLCVQLKELCFARGAEDNLTAIVVDLGERRYADEPDADETTRPKVASTVLPAGKGATTSRFDVEFTPNSQPEPTKMQPRNSTTPRTAARRSSIIGGIFQLVLLLAGLALAFFAGRYWDQLYAWTIGSPAGTDTAANGAGTPSVNPEMAAARALFEERRYEKARDRFAEFVRQEPTNAEYRYWLGRAQFETRQYAEAVKNLNEAARLNEKLPNVYVHLALAQEAVGDHRGAGESLRRAVAVSEMPVTSVAPSVAPSAAPTSSPAASPAH